MEFDTIHFKLTDALRARTKFPKDHVERHKLAKPEPLYVLCARVCDYLPEEKCFRWTNMQVLMWLSSIGFPQYRNTFFVNMINGRTLLLLDASALCAMNVEDFDHIKIIAKAVRDLYKIEKVLFKRSISLPPRYPDTHFKYYRVCTGPTYQRTKRSQLWRRMHLVQPFPPHRNHWRTLHEYLQHQPQNQMHRIGYAPRANMYYVRPNPNPLPEVSSSINIFDKPCDCIPPCECKWSEANYREPWTLTCVLGPAALCMQEQLQDGDIIVTEEPKPTKALCSCVFPHECQWHIGEGAPQVLTVLRCWESLVKECSL